MSAQPHPVIESQDSDAPWHELLGQVGSEVGQALTHALERVTALTTTGRIDREGLRALREEIEHARRAGMIGQQLARYASGRIRQSPEQLSLTQMLRDVLVQRGREVAAHGLEVHQSMRPVEIVCDATLLHALLQAVVDWTLEHAHRQVEFRIDRTAWPPNAQLICHFTVQRVPDHPAAEALLADTSASTTLNSMPWRLLQQLGRNLGLRLERKDSRADTTLVLEFPRTVNDQLEGVTAIEIDQGFGVSENSKPLAGSHVLVVANRRDLRSDIRDATRHMGLLIDFVNSVEEAEVFCREALPHAIVIESALAGQRFDKLCAELRTDAPGTVFIEIAQEGARFELSRDNSRQRSVVGRAAVLESLPSALFFELSRTM